MPGQWRAKMRAAGVSYSDWRRARAYVAATLPAPCSVCGDQVQPWEPWQLDHVVPLARGGHPLALDNIAPSHKRCNASKGAGRTTPPPIVKPSRDW